MRIVLTTTQALVDQMDPAWQGVYTWLIENTSEVCLSVWDEGGLIVFEGEITCNAGDDHLARFEFDDTIVNVTVGPLYGAPYGAQVRRETVELSHPDSLDRIARIIG